MMINSFFLLVSSIIETSKHANAYPQQAFLPLLLIVAGIGLLVGTIIIVIAGKSAPEVFKGRNIDLVILGPNVAGKTTLWNMIKRKENSRTYNETDGTQKVDFMASNIIWTLKQPVNFSEKDSAGNQPKLVHVKGCDINGHMDYIRKEWKKLIKESNMIIFVFNAYDYLHKENYKRDVNQRLQFVKNEMDMLKNDQKERAIWLLGSYADKLNQKKDDWAQIINCIKQKSYCEIAGNNACIALTNKEEVIQYLKKIFGCEQWT